MANPRRALNLKLAGIVSGCGSDCKGHRQSNTSRLIALRRIQCKGSSESQGNRRRFFETAPVSLSKV